MSLVAPGGVLLHDLLVHRKSWQSSARWIDVICLVSVVNGKPEHFLYYPRLLRLLHNVLQVLSLNLEGNGLVGVRFRRMGWPTHLCYPDRLVGKAILSCYLVHRLPPRVERRNGAV